jgi:hypothetical protein
VDRFLFFYALFQSKYQIRMSVEWKSEAFRSSLVRKLEEAIRESGSQNQKSAVEAENQVTLSQCCGSESEIIRMFWLDPNPKKSADSDSDTVVGWKFL